VQELAFEQPKTRQAASVLDALELQGRVLVVLPEPTDDGAVELSFRNLPTVKIAYARGLGVYDVLRADRVLFTAGALEAIQGARGADDAAGGEAS
jgi:large subunit ribosomal protein L4